MNIAADIKGIQKCEIMAGAGYNPFFADNS
jgi:hypothetical protein